jgi:hypothetical protein
LNIVSHHLPEQDMESGASPGESVTVKPPKGTSKNSGLVMRREILFQIEGQKTQESFVAFKFFARKAGTKDPA